MFGGQSRLTLETSKVRSQLALLTDIDVEIIAHGFKRSASICVSVFDKSCMNLHFPYLSCCAQLNNNRFNWINGAFIDQYLEV